MKKLIISVISLIPILSIGQNDNSTSPTEKQSKWQIGIQLNTIPPALPDIGGANNLLYNLEEQDIAGTYGQNGRTSQSDPLTNTHTSTIWTSKDASYSLSFFVAYSLNSNWSIRLKGGISHFDLMTNQQTYDSSQINYIITSNTTDTYKRDDWQFSIGIQKTYTLGHFDITGGAEIPVIIRGIGTWSNSGTDDTNYVFSGSASSTRIYNNGWSMGLGFFFNLTYRWKFISIGPEISLAYMYNHIGGDFTETDYNSNGNNSFTDFTGYTINKFCLSPVSASINLIVHF